MAAPTVSNVHVDQPLTNLSIGYNPAGFVAESVLPVMNVNFESDKYYVWDRQSAFQEYEALRADGTEAKVVEFGLTAEAYLAEEYALATKVTDREVDNADSVLRLRESKARRLQNLLLLQQEKRVAELLTTAGNYDGNTDTPSVKWDASSGTIDIEGDLDDAKEAVRQVIGMEPTDIIIPPSIAKVVKKNSTVRELIKYTQNDLLVNGDLPPTLFNLRVHIPGAISTSSTEGAASVTYGDIWGDNVILIWNGADAAIDSPHFGKIFRARNFLTKAWRDEKRASEFIEVSHVQDEVITSGVSGYLLTNVLT